MSRGSRGRRTCDIKRNLHEAAQGKGEELQADVYPTESAWYHEGSARGEREAEMPKRTGRRRNVQSKGNESRVQVTPKLQAVMRTRSTQHRSWCPWRDIGRGRHRNERRCGAVGHPEDWCRVAPRPHGAQSRSAVEMVEDVEATRSPDGDVVRHLPTESVKIGNVQR